LSFFSGFSVFCRLAWRVLRVPFWLGVGALAGFLAPYGM